MIFYLDLTRVLLFCFLKRRHLGRHTHGVCMKPYIRDLL